MLLIMFLFFFSFRIEARPNAWGFSLTAPSLLHCRCLTTSAFHGKSSSAPSLGQKKPSYSYVVVGAGSAGCVLANRLTEDTQESVCLLEAGPKDKWLGSSRLSWKIHMPAALTYNLCDDKYSNLKCFFLIFFY